MTNVDCYVWLCTKHCATTALIDRTATQNRADQLYAHLDCYEAPMTVLVVSDLAPKWPTYPFSKRYFLNSSSSLLRSRSLSGMRNHEISAPVMAKAEPMRNTPCKAPSSLEKDSWMGVNTSVPMTAPAFPTAAARPRKWPRMGVGKDSAQQRNVATCWPDQ